MWTVVNSQLPSAGISLHLIAITRAGLAFRGNSCLSYLNNVCKLTESVNNLNTYFVFQIFYDLVTKTTLDIAKIVLQFDIQIYEFYFL
jgi:hypothetical protein